MRAFGILTALCMLALGCKKQSKPTEADTAPPPVVAGQKPQPAPANSGGGGTNVGVIPAGGVGVVTNPGAIMGGGGGGGAVMAVRKAARRTQALNELKNLGEFIAGMQDEFGKMPTKERILAELKTGAPAIYKAIVEDGSYVLTGTTEAGGLWAYEVDADTKPGIAVIGGRATRSTPDELAPYFRKN